MTFLLYSGRVYAARQAGTYSELDRTGEHGLGQRGSRSSGATRCAADLQRKAAVAAIIDFRRLLEGNDGGRKDDASAKVQQNQPPAPRTTAVL